MKLSATDTLINSGIVAAEMEYPLWNDAYVVGDVRR